MIHHGPVPDSPEAFVFANLFSTCSICAPLNWPKAWVERFACEHVGGEGWQSVDPQKLFGQTSRFKSSPHPCNQAPDKRQHWFLVRNP